MKDLNLQIQSLNSKQFGLKQSGMGGKKEKKKKMMEKYTLYLVLGFVACVEEEGWGELRGLYRAERFVPAEQPARCCMQGAAALCAFELQGHSPGEPQPGAAHRGLVCPSG